MPNPNPNTRGLIPGKSTGRKPLNRDRYNVSLDPNVSDRVAQIADNMGTSKPKVIELLVRHALDMYAIGDYDKGDIESILRECRNKNTLIGKLERGHIDLIIKGAPIE